MASSASASTPAARAGSRFSSRLQAAGVHPALRPAGAGLWTAALAAQRHWFYRAVGSLQKPGASRLGASPAASLAPRQATVTRRAEPRASRGCANLQIIRAFQPQRARGLGRLAGKPGDRARSWPVGAQRRRARMPPREHRRRLPQDNPPRTCEPEPSRNPAHNSPILPTSLPLARSKTLSLLAKVPTAA